MPDQPLPNEPIPEVDADEARARIAAGARLLDVREPDEWQAGHAPEAQFIPLGEVPSRTGEISPDGPIVVICRAGSRSERAARYLRGEGYDVVNLTGGMRAWAAAGHDVVTDDGSAGTVI